MSTWQDEEEEEEEEEEEKRRRKRRRKMQRKTLKRVMTEVERSLSIKQNLSGLSSIIDTWSAGTLKMGRRRSRRKRRRRVMKRKQISI